MPMSRSALTIATAKTAAAVTHNQIGMGRESMHLRPVSKDIHCLRRYPSGYKLGPARNHSTQVPGWNISETKQVPLALPKRSALAKKLSPGRGELFSKGAALG